MFFIQDVRKSVKCNGLTNTAYKQSYELYLKTIEYKNILKKSAEKKEENNEGNEPLNTTKPMECPDKLYIKPDVSL